MLRLVSAGLLEQTYERKTYMFKTMRTAQTSRTPGFLAHQHLRATLASLCVMHAMVTLSFKRHSRIWKQVLAEIWRDLQGYPCYVRARKVKI